MLAWLDQAIAGLEQHADLLLITVAEVRGSAPRNAATRMLVATNNQWLTIGGGNLEWQATAKARDYLQQIASQDRQLLSSSAILEKQSDFCQSYTKQNIWFDIFQLGPSLGQCCGGVVGVLFEHISRSDLPWLKFLQQTYKKGQIVKKIIQHIPANIDESAALANHSTLKPAKIDLIIVDDDELSAAKKALIDSLTSAQKAAGIPDLCWFKREPGGGFIYTEFLEPEELNIYVFGAGHVGKALVNLLGTLPCNVFWVDSRAEQFPENVANNVTIEETDIPEAVIDTALPNSCYVIMTHDHALDQKLCEQIMKRDDALYFGLIGSRTKKHKFEHRFKAKGIDSDLYEKMICPIGIPQIKGKQPSIIALAVAAQLMSLRDKGHLYAQEADAELAV